MTRASWLGAQGVGEAIERYAAMAQALVRWWELAGDEQGDGKKTEQGSGDQRRRPRLNSVAQKRKEAM